MASMIYKLSLRLILKTHYDFVCKNYVLNSSVNSLYNMHSTMKTAKKFGESLDYKYKTKDTGIMKLATS